MSDFEDGPEQVPLQPEETAAAPAEASEQSDDPVEEALYTSFMQAQATGADASQALDEGSIPFTRSSNFNHINALPI